MGHNQYADVIITAFVCGRGVWRGVDEGKKVHMATDGHVKNLGFLCHDWNCGDGFHPPPPSQILHFCESESNFTSFGASYSVTVIH